jgi:hypothetical protein
MYFEQEQDHSHTGSHDVEDEQDQAENKEAKKDEAEKDEAEKDEAEKDEAALQIQWASAEYL